MLVPGGTSQFAKEKVLVGAQHFARKLLQDCRQQQMHDMTCAGTDTARSLTVPLAGRGLDSGISTVSTPFTCYLVVELH